jgi:ribosomal protein S18 acetylase RimI-like enzyme
MESFDQRHAEFTGKSMTIVIDGSMEAIDWVQAKADLAAGAFDNGRSPEALCRSFQRSQHVAFARDGQHLVGMARLLSDGVCNAYLLDVWVAMPYRRQGIGSEMVTFLAARVPGQHIGLQTDDAEPFYASLGFQIQPIFMSQIVGSWLEKSDDR